MRLVQAELISVMFPLLGFLREPSITTHADAAARIPTDPKHRARITPVLKELHWLPVSARTQFKVLLLVYKALNNLEPAYITERLSVQLVILDLQMLAFCENLLQNTGSSFSYYASKLGSSIPASIRHSSRN